MTDIVRIPLTKGFEAIVDADDLDHEHVAGFAAGFEWRGRVSDRNWQAQVRPHTVYARTMIWHGGRQHELRLHRLIMDAKAGVLVDHKDGNGLDCRRENLRIASFGLNSANRSVSGDWSSRFKGVAHNRLTGKFEAYIRFEGKKRHLGLHGTEEAAARAYDEKAIELWGEFSRLNFPTTALQANRRAQ